MEFLSWVLRRLRRTQNGPVSRRQVTPLVNYLRDARLLPNPGENLSASVSRLAHLAPRLADDVFAVEDIVATLSALEAVETGMETRREEAKEELKNELEPTVRKELEGSLTDLVARRDQLHKEIASATAATEAENRRATAAETAARGLEVALADELAAVGIVLDGLGEVVPGKASDLAGRLAERLGEVPLSFGLVPGPLPPWNRPTASRGAPTPWSEASASLRAAAKRYGYDPEEILFADIAARSGLVLILPDESALDFVRCYASAVTGGAAAIEALHPAVIALDDLWRQPATGEPTGFAHEWTAAIRDPCRYRILLLDGLQRTPSDLWASSLVNVMGGSERPANMLVFASIGKGFVDRNRVWTGLEDVFVPFVPSSPTWPSTRLLQRLAGEAESTSWLDAQAAPQPARAEIATYLDHTVAESDVHRMARSLALFAAGCAVESAATASKNVVEFLAREVLPLKRGAEWMRELLASIAD